jgi:PIN domain nuclease of toxin-antitoxin system
MAQFLIDTHVFLWSIQGDEKLSAQASRIISDSNNQLYLSVASIWEIVIKINIGKLKVDYGMEDVYDLLRQFQIEVLSIESQGLAQYLVLLLHHRDPFDRILIAQVIARSLVLVSADEAFSAYSVQRIWE